MDNLTYQNNDGKNKIALNIIINVYVLSVVSLVVVSIITTAGTIVGTAAFGSLFLNNPNVCDSNSYFFMSNFILIIACTCILSVYKIKSKTSIKDILHFFPPGKLCTFLQEHFRVI